MGPTMTEITFTTSDDRKLICTLWDRVTRPRGIIQIIHGMDEYIDRYDRFARFMNAHGYIVFGDDHRAHGRTAGRDKIGITDGDMDLFDATVADELEIMEYLRGRFNLPLILFGHSYGSFITQSIITQTSAHSGVCLSGTAMYPRPMLWAANTAAALGKKWRGADAPAHFLERFSPIRSRHNGPDPLTRDTRISADAARDPMRGHTFSYGFYHAMFKNLMHMRRWANPDIPMLIIGGDDDAVGGRGKYATRLYRFYQRAGVHDVSLILYPGARHELLMEVNYTDVHQDILNFADNALKNAQCVNRCSITIDTENTD